MQHKVRIARLALGLTQNQLAAKAGISNFSVSNAENLSRNYRVHQEVAAAIARALRKRVSDLFDAEELSNRGRKPKSGKPLTLSDESRVKVCPVHFVTLPHGTLVCDECA